jgi:hypothetical protein
MPVTLHVYILHHTSLQKRYENCLNMVEMLTAVNHALNRPLRINVEILNEQDGERRGRLEKRPERPNRQPLVNGFETTAVCYDDNISDKTFLNYRQHLSPAMVSNACKHRRALQLVAENALDNGDDLHLILEDDVMVGQDIVNNFMRVVQEAITVSPSKCILCVGIPLKPTTEVSSPFDLLSFITFMPSCEAYFVTASAAKLLAQNMTPLRFVTNVQLTFIAKQTGINIVCSCPNTFVDGSKIGVQLSSIAANSEFEFNLEFVDLFKRIRERKESCAVLLSAYENSRTVRNPTFEALVCQALIQEGSYAKARELLEAGFIHFSSETCPLDGSSVFMQTYMTAHKHFQ